MMSLAISKLFIWKEVNALKAICLSIVPAFRDCLLVRLLVWGMKTGPIGFPAMAPGQSLVRNLIPCHLIRVLRHMGLVGSGEFPCSTEPEMAMYSPAVLSILKKPNLFC